MMYNKGFIIKIVSYKIMGTGEEILSRSFLISLILLLIYFYSPGKPDVIWKDHVIGVMAMKSCQVIQIL